MTFYEADEADPWTYLWIGFDGTRAKKLLILVGSRSTVEQMVANNRRTLRYTNLKAMLIEACRNGD